jgi:hypothetical protein
MTEHEHVEALVERWRARRAWAASLLTERLGLRTLLDILRLGRNVEQEVPGTGWRYQTHGVGVSVHRSDETGGIDFEIHELEPDGWRLHTFARRQVEEGALPQEVYARVFDDPHRLDTLLADLLGRAAGAE